MRLFLLALAVMLGASAQARAAGWQDAVRTLAQERTKAETCAGIVRKFGDDGAKARAALVYGAARGRYDGVIAGLIVALAGGDAPDSLDDLEGQLRAGHAELGQFCAGAETLLPAASGERDWRADIASSAVEPLVKAAAAIYLDYRKRAEMTRKTIQTQLEEAKWSPFASVPPLF
jgi:hypothetical protein